MALMKCPECKNEVGNKAAICPTCGCSVWGKKDENYTKRIREQNIEAVKALKLKRYQYAMELCDSNIQEYNKFKSYLDGTDSNVDISQTKCYDYLKHIYFNYGDLHSRCDSPYYDLSKAKEYFVLSGDIGYSGAYRYIGYMYDPYSTVIDNKDIKSNEQAKIWYKKAISVDGDYTALNNLGTLYGRKGDYKLGAFYCWVAYKLGNQGALGNYNYCLSNLSTSYDSYFKSLSVTTSNIFELETAFLTWHQNFGKKTISKSVVIQNHIVKHKIKYIIGAIAIFLAFLIVLGAITSGGGSGGGSDDTIRCKSCYRSFAEGTSNANSIHRTNMCKNCYENYKWSQNALDGLS